MSGLSTPKRARPGERSRWRAGRIMMFVLLGGALSSLAFGATAQAAGFASESLCTAARRGLDLALPAVLRIATTYQAQLIYTSGDGSSVTFPQDGSFYTITVSGTAAFISGTGDALTASSAVNVPQDTLNLLLAERAAPDIAQALNNAHPSQPVTAASILAQLLADPQSWQPVTQQPQSALYLGSPYSGQTAASSLDGLQSYPVTVVAQSASDQQIDNDLTILHVDGLSDLPTIPLGDATAVYPGDTLTIIGYPGSADLAQPDGTVDPNNFITPSVKTVTVSAFKTAQNGSQLIQVEGDLEQGDSGAPALNADGQLVGIVSLAAGGGNGVGQASFLHTVNDARDLARQAKVNLAQDAFDMRWAAAYDACASSQPGHWHDASNQYTQIARLYPNFKGVQPYLTYTRAQAAHEPVPLSLPAWAIVLIVVVILAAAVALFLLLRRRSRRRGGYAGYGPGLYQNAPYSTVGYGPGTGPSTGQQPAFPGGSEQISATVSSSGGFSSTRPDLPPTSPDLPPD
jgi:hypothetical protein